MSNIRNNSTINYYNLHAKEYFETTVNTDVSECSGIVGTGSLYVSIIIM